jgi:hypothetical protein
MRFNRYLPAFFAVTAFCASLRNISPAAGHLHKEIYPKVIDCSDSQNVNMYGSAVFRMRHSRFLNEIADSLRRVTRDLSDSGAEKRVLLAFGLDRTGKVADVTVDCADSAGGAFKDALHARVLSWKFNYSPALPLRVIEDLRITKRRQQGFFRRHRTAGIIGLIVLGVLVIF